MGCEKVVAITVHPAARPACAPEENPRTPRTPRGGTKQRSAGQKRLRMWLAARDLIRGNDPLRHGNSSVREPHPRQPFGGAGHDRPTVAGQRRSSSRTPGSTVSPSLSSISRSSIIFSSASESRSGRSLAKVSMRGSHARCGWRTRGPYRASAPISSSYVPPIPATRSESHPCRTERPGNGFQRGKK